MYDDLVKRLRNAAQWADKGLVITPSVCLSAADAIEKLSVVVRAQKAVLEKFPRWIPVTERLPQGGDKGGQICVNVLLYFDDGNVYPGWMNGCSEKVYYLDDDNDYVFSAPISRVKMWQPLPEPPEEG